MALNTEACRIQILNVAMLVSGHFIALFSSASMNGRTSLKSMNGLSAKRSTSERHVFECLPEEDELKGTQSSVGIISINALNCADLLILMLGTTTSHCDGEMSAEKSCFSLSAASLDRVAICSARFTRHVARRWCLSLLVPLLNSRLV